MDHYDRQTKGSNSSCTAAFPRLIAQILCQASASELSDALQRGKNLKNQLWSNSVVEWELNMEKMKELNEDAYNWLGEMSPNTWVRAFFSEFPKCDILLNNSCEVFNKYILKARELPILSMMEKIKGQLMARFNNKQKECENWQGPFCPNIRKKVLKNSDQANICYVLPAGKGIFQVQERDFTYIVDIISKHCDCRRWDLTGIPCCHAIACLREERISAEYYLPRCYSIEAFWSVYGSNIMPCNDKRKWEKMNGPPVLPPLYVKKASRPKKNRKKQPEEVQGKNGPKLSKHGVTLHCSYCHEPNHNKKGCQLRKKAIKPKMKVIRKLVSPPVEGNQEFASNQEPTITQELTEANHAVGSAMHHATHTMLDHMMAESSQPSQLTQQLGPLPDCASIQHNQHVATAVPLTTATKQGRATTAKRKKNASPAKKKKARSAKKKTIVHIT